MMLTTAEGMKWPPACVHKFPFALNLFIFLFLKSYFCLKALACGMQMQKLGAPSESGTELTVKGFHF